MLTVKKALEMIKMGELTFSDKLILELEKCPSDYVLFVLDDDSGKLYAGIPPKCLTEEDDWWTCPILDSSKHSLRDSLSDKILDSFDKVSKNKSSTFDDTVKYYNPEQ